MSIRSRSVLRGFSRFLFVVIVFAAAALGSAARQIISLDGEWRLAEGNLTTVTANYERTVPVPGLVDMAVPPFENLGTTTTKQQAYWYRRSFAVPGSLPSRATLHIGKVAYGMRVYLNGILLRDEKQRVEFWNSFASVRLDCGGALRGNGKENVLEIRAGERSTLPPDVPNGRDFEKIVYQPGVYDSVELILSGTPAISDVQVAPRLESSSIDVQFALTRAETNDVPTSCTIREARSKRIVGELQTRVHQVNGTSSILSLKLENPHLWTPEDPFLYELELATAGDNSHTRFGMRSFSFDQPSGRALLNGKPYYLRGTNVCIFRFFEDSERKRRPWDRDWVRRLHQAFKTMHWNSIRYCIGFPPESWYDIADEEGFLIQDEFPIWNGSKPTPTPPDKLSQMYTEWMRDHWNHPSVVIWDAQNETITSATGAAIQLARAADLSNRPWDNGWSPAQSPADCFEVHPYIFNNPSGLMEDLQDITPDFVGTPQNNVRHNAQIINEYAWLWLNRDGSPCTLTTKIYDRLLGPAATADQRRALYAHNLAEQTEFWRATRRYAGVLQFCGLSYSRPGGQTSDNFTNVGSLTFEPHFAARIGDAFAPVGVCIDKHLIQYATGQQYEIPVSVVNDLDRSVNPSVRLKLVAGERTLWVSEPRRLQLDSLDKMTTTFTITMPDQPSSCTLVAELAGAPGQPAIASRRDIDVMPSATVGLAVAVPATASSWYKEGGRRNHLTSAPTKALDGSLNTRWSSEFSQPQWLSIDFGHPETFSRVQIVWEKAYALAYRLQVSDDSQTWHDIYVTQHGNGGTEDISLANTTARYLRLYCETRATDFGFSVYELKAF